MDKPPQRERPVAERSNRDCDVSGSRFRVVGVQVGGLVADYDFELQSALHRRR